MVTDPNGLQSGFPLNGANPIQNIPNSGAGVDETDDVVTGGAGTPVQSVMINSPAAGAFQVSLTGTSVGQFSLEIAAEAADGTVKSLIVSGSTAAGAATTYGLTYSTATGGAQITSLNGSSTSSCDVNYDGSTNVSDVQTEVNQALGVAIAANDHGGQGIVNIADVQIVINAALHLGCSSS
jgi:hypothetical protein